MNIHIYIHIDRAIQSENNPFIRPILEQAYRWKQLLQHTGDLRIEHLALALLGEYGLDGSRMTEGATSSECLLKKKKHARDPCMR